MFNFIMLRRTKDKSSENKKKKKGRRERRFGEGLGLERKGISNSNFPAQPLLNEEEAFK